MISGLIEGRNVRVGRFLGLRLRAKSVGGAIAVLAISSLGIAVWGATALCVPSFTKDSGQATTLAEFFPIVTGSLVAFSCRSSMGDFEDVAPRRRVRVQGDYLALAFLVTACVQTVVLILGGQDMAATGFRNYLGYCGAALASVTFLGSDKSWILPLGLAFPAFFVASSSGTLPGALWSWPTLPVENRTSWAVALLWAVLGAASFLCRTSLRMARMNVR